MKKFVVFLMFLSIIISCSTKGSVIGNYSNPQKALVVMDMQNDALGKDAKTPIANSADNLIKVVNIIIDDYSSKGYKIIYIKTEHGYLLDAGISV